MRNVKISKNPHRLVLSGLVKKFYDEIAEYESKPEDMSKSLYFTCLAIRFLENMGNKFPSQTEIDVVESIIKAKDRAQLHKVILKAAA
ncbi:MAG TPA: hypothetical protein VHE99_00380 [Gammaproteobacteria bacterium]|nr:hypothetical protein [Gammaproteobacteria bacterium]